MGQTKRSDIVSKELESSPGPGIYTSQNKTIQYNDSRKVTISPHKQESKRDPTPGPGQYNENMDVVKDKSRSVLISSQSQRIDVVGKHVRDTPGPGLYDSPNKGNTTSFTIGGKARE